MLSNSFLGSVIGYIDSEIGQIPFFAKHRSFQEFVSRPKLDKDATPTTLRPVIYSNKGQFVGPPIRCVVGAFKRMTYQTAPVVFRNDFKVLNILLADLANRQIVKPLGMKYPIVVDPGDRLQFELTVEIYQ